MNRLVEKVDRIEDRFLEVKRVKIRLSNELISPEIKVVGRQIFSRLPFNHLLFIRRQRSGQSASDCFRNLALHSKDISDIAVITVRPNIIIVAGID